MHDFLPLFPLKLVVYPGEQLNLHIFEPRYKQLIREAEQNATTFGIPAFIDDRVMDIGTEIKLLSIEKKHSNGSMDIKTMGVGVFKIDTFYREAPQKLYAGADIHRLELELDGDDHLGERILEKMEELYNLLKINKSLPSGASDLQTYLVAHHVGFSIEQEYELLSIPTEYQRQEYLLSHLTSLLPTVKEMHRLQERVKMNGHFRNEIPPEI